MYFPRIKENFWLNNRIMKNFVYSFIFRRVCFVLVTVDIKQLSRANLRVHFKHMSWKNAHVYLGKYADKSNEKLLNT